MEENDRIEVFPCDYGPGVENYECSGCRVDEFTDFNCGVCPRNEERIREYNERYIM